VRFWRTISFGALVLSGCGYIGEPLPPALHIPSRITDLRAIERGEKIVVQFTLPPLTTEGRTLTGVRSVDLRAGPGSNPFSIDAWGAGAKSFDVPASAPGAMTREIPAREWVGMDVVLAVRATGPKGKVSDWSNLVILPITQPLTRPVSLKAENVERGVAISWQGTGPRYRVFRAVGENPPERLADTDEPEYLDESTAYGAAFKYFVQAIAGELTQSDLSETVMITPVDEFPPAVPAALTAEPGAGTIELAWDRNAEPDFRGYNIYRSMENMPFEKIASLIEAPAYSDRNVEAGKRYRYEVSAVDQTGNESQRSTIVEATVQ
jgi:hypothetical protein